MKNVKLKCGNCGNNFDKPKKEYTRQLKHGRKVFYCNLSCHGKTNHGHLTPYKYIDGNTGGGSRKDEYSDYRVYLRRANRRNKTVDMSLEDIKLLWGKQDGKCAYTGVPLQHPNENKKSCHDFNYTASLDRIDSSVGYVASNIQFVSITCNLLKSNKNGVHVKEFLTIVRNSKMVE